MFFIHNVIDIIHHLKFVMDLTLNKNEQKTGRSSIKWLGNMGQKDLILVNYEMVYFFWSLYYAQICLYNNY